MCLWPRLCEWRLRLGLEGEDAIGDETDGTLYVEFERIYPDEKEVRIYGRDLSGCRDGNEIGGEGGSDSGGGAYVSVISAMLKEAASINSILSTSRRDVVNARL